MTATPADDLSLAAQVDAACDRFESEFRAGQHPRLEAFLADVTETNRSKLFQSLLEVELELRQSQGKPFATEDYATRFPEYLQIIDAAIQRAREFPGKRSSVIITGVETSRGPGAKKANPPPASVSLPLSAIGRFQVVTLLGEGAFGSVYKAHDPQLDREVAIKVPRSASHRSDEERERFLREGRAAAALHHPNICPVYEVGTTPEGRDYIVMAFIEGRPLSRVLQAPQRLTDRQIVNAIRRLALALEEAHAKGIIHRDLKPANIMINRKGEPVIMDFGLARRATATDAQISHSGQIMGTPAYMSPEQARGDVKGVGPLSDLYSLGLVMYEMLCGRRPFEGTVTEVIGQILHVEPPPPSQFRQEIDPHLESICLKAIAKRPDDRYASMKDFATALSQYATAMANAKPGAASSQKDAFDSGDPLHTQQLAKLVAAVSSDVESKINRAAGRLGGGGRPPLWVTLAGSGFMGVIVLLGILFFVRAGDTTILIQVPLPPGVDLEDTSLAFFLDEKPIAAEQIGQPIELTPGDHELVIRRGDQVVERMRFAVEKEGKNWNIARVETNKESGSPQLAVAPFTAEQARESQEAWAKHLGVPVEFTNSIGMNFRLIPPGEYSRGTPADEYESVLPTLNSDPWLTQCLESEKLVHPVKLTRPFYLGTHEVTQRQYERMVGSNPSHFSASGEGRDQIAGKDTADFPVERVNWDEALEFCNRLSQSESLIAPKVELRAGELSLSSGDGYRLPTEAEWEYACRAGTTSRFWTGENAASLDQAAWYGANSEQRTHAVGELRPNPFGLFDIHGNAWEWVQDWWNKDSYKPFAETPAVDPLGAVTWTGQPLRVVRGGFMGYGPNWSRAAHRNGFAANTRFGFIGFRVVMSVDGVKKLLSAPRQNSDREVAEWVLRIGGTVSIERDNGAADTLQESGDLPGERFRLVAIALPTHIAEHWTDDDLRRLESLSHLRNVDLRRQFGIGDMTLARLSAVKSIEDLHLLGEATISGKGLELLASLPKLHRLVFSSTSFADSDAAALSKLTHLKSLWVQVPQVTDAGFAHLSSLQNLDSLIFDATNLTPAGISVLQRMNITQLNAPHGMTDEKLVPVAKLVGLVALWIDNSNVTDAGLTHLAGLKNLTNLDLYSSPRINGSGFEHLRGLQSLRTIMLHGTRTNDAGLAHLRKLTSLESVNLTDCPVTDEGLTHLSGMPNLAAFDLSGTLVSDHGIDHLRTMPSLRQVWFQRTAVTEVGRARLRAAIPDCRVYPEDATDDPRSLSDTGFVSLFNGQDLAGWKVSGPAGWSVRNGAVFVDGSKSGELTCERQFDDFELTGEVFTTAKGNGAVQFRVSSQPIDNVVGLGGYEFQVAGSQGDPGKNYTGGLYEGGQSAVRVNPPVAKDSTWTAIRLRVEGTHLQGWVDGRLTFDARGKPERMAGRMLKLNSFAQGGEVGYRNFRIRPLTQSAKVGPPADARTFNGHSYKFFPEQLSWKEAKARCESMGGRLAMVESPEENAFVAGLVSAAGKVDAWIGATDEGSEGQWRWVDGHLMTWTNWFKDQKQPNNKGGVEHFGLMSNKNLANGKTIGWQWSDQPNESTQHQPGFVCEWE